MPQRRPNTFAQTILSFSFFACDEAADHTFRVAGLTSKWTGFVNTGPTCGYLFVVRTHCEVVKYSWQPTRKR